MKRLLAICRGRRPLLALALAALLGPGAPAAAADDGQQATVSRLEGKAFQAVAENGPWNALKLKETVVSGRYVRTADRARAELSLPDGSAVRLAPGTTMKLSHLYFPKRKGQKQFQARLILGRFWGKVRAFAGGDSFFKVHTGGAVAGVRGTAFQVNYGGEGSDATFKVYEGRVAVQSYAEALERPDTGPLREVSGPQEVSGPREVSREEWEHIVGTWQYITVSAQGVPSAPADIDPAADAEADDFSAWNREIDGIVAPESETPETQTPEREPSEPPVGEPNEIPPPPAPAPQ